MNPLTYETKRAHWKATWFGIRLFRDCAKRWGELSLRDMTPARFDVLYATWMHKAHERCHAEDMGFQPARHIPMGELRKLLGLAGSTISRTAHQLEVLRYVRVRRDDPNDRRRVSVTLTDEGIAVLQLAIDCITLEKGGVRTHIEKYVNRCAADGLSREGTRAEVHQRILGRLCAIVDRAQAFAWFLGSKAMPIYDTRVCEQIPYPDVIEYDH